MDLFGIKLYLEQYKRQYSKWLKEQRGVYTNKDYVIDHLQLFAIICIAALEIYKW